MIGQPVQDAGSDGQAKAERAISIITSGDAGIRAHDADGGKTTDAGKPAQQPAQRDAGGSRPSGGDAPDAAASTGTRAAQDGAAPGMTKPDTMKQCMPGVYEGTFEGPVTFAVGSINSVTGSMRAELVLEPSGDALQIRDGMMKGMDNAGIGMTAGWTGRLNCATKQLENGRHESGAWQNGSTFTGTLEGSYTVDPYSLSGTWKVQSEQIPLAGGNGTWHVTLRDNPTP